MPALVFGAEIERARMLQIRRQDHGLVTGRTWKLHPEVPAVKRDEGKLQVLGEQVLLGKGVEAVDGVTESASVPNLVPSERRQARWEVVR